jgi:transposase InsO family protein
VPVKAHKKRRLGHSDNGIVGHRALRKNDVWTWDFVHDSDEGGRPLTWFSLVDEYTRECLSLEVNRSMTGVDVIEVLAELLCRGGLLGHARSDNGREFVATAIRQYLGKAGISALYIERGVPRENDYGECFQTRLRDELLNLEVSAKLAEATGQRHGDLGGSAPEPMAYSPPVQRQRLRPGVGLYWPDSHNGRYINCGHVNRVAAAAWQAASPITCGYDVSLEVERESFGYRDIEATTILPIVPIRMTRRHERLNGCHLVERRGSVTSLGGYPNWYHAGRKPELRVLSRSI